VTPASSSPPVAENGEGQLSSAYEKFLASVVGQQLRAWLPAERCRVLDISCANPARGAASASATIARAGHDVVRVLSPDTLNGPPGTRVPRSPAVSHVVGDTRSLDWFRSGRLDAVVAEGSAMSACLATETTVEQAARLLHPGGRLLLSVDSLLYGLARLAEQHRWPELADASAGDVVLVQDQPDSYTRCFGPEELHELVDSAGFDVDWVRPRTVIPPDVVDHAVRNDPSVLADLVARELTLAAERQGESLGMYLTLSATLRG
jgi:hypothetical protein